MESPRPHQRLCPLQIWGAPLKQSGHGQGGRHRPWKRCKGQLGRYTDTSSVPPPTHPHCMHPGGGVEEVSSAG